MFKKEIKKECQKTKGFTLVEALVAFSVLTIALGAFISSTTTSIKTFRSVEKSYLANEIAKEGMEIVTSKMSNSYKACVVLNKCDDWRLGLGDGSYEVSSFRYGELMPEELFSGFDEGDSRPRPLCFLADEIQDGGPPVPTPGSKGRFGYCTGTLDERDSGGEIIAGNFYREIVITSLGNGNSKDDPEGIRVQSIVKWGGTDYYSADYETVLEVYLYAN